MQLEESNEQRKKEVVGTSKATCLKDLNSNSDAKIAAMMVRDAKPVYFIAALIEDLKWIATDRKVCDYD